MVRKQAEILERSSELSSDIEHSGGTWVRFPDYAISGTGRDRYIQAKKPGPRPATDQTSEDGETWWKGGWVYQPLAKYPDLFLRFARLADEGKLDPHKLNSDTNADAALWWARRFGTLGLTGSKKRREWWGDPRGGRMDNVAAFAFEALVANAVLRLYEVATDPHGVDVSAIAELTPNRHRGLITSTPDMARDWALEQVVNNVRDRIAWNTCQQLYWRRADDRFVEGYDFRSLLGALYMQAAWLLQADRPGRCRNPECPRIMAFEQPEQKPDPGVANDRGMGYRKRADAEYCSKPCRNAHYYERETKPRRQAARARRTAAGK